VTSSMLEVSNVSKAFGRFQALRGVSFSVQTGSRTLLLGPNGAGKSTLIKAIMGLYKFEGSVRVDGLDVTKEGSKARERMGYVPQNSAFYTRLTVEQEARLIGVVKGVSNETVDDKLERLGLGKARNKTIGSLSGGARQRFALAMALLTNPPMLIFDEPLANIDLKGQLDFLGLVRNLALGGHTLLIATHLTGLSEFADQVVVLNRGRKIAEGTPDVLLAQLDADQTLYVKAKVGHEKEVNEILARNQAKIIDDRSQTLVVSIPNSRKFALLNNLFSNGGILDDIAIEPSKIEAAYTKFLEEKAPEEKVAA
jgi:Cu-processing system ATP-binding protein